MRSFVIFLALVALVPASAHASLPPQLDWEVVSRRVHDTGAYTQGLLLDDDGRLFESTGQRGASNVREVDPRSGVVLRTRPLLDDWFGEGLALVDDELIGLTWKAGIALRWDKETFELTGSHRYEGQGWGLCHDGERLIMSDGSSRLTFRDAKTFEPIGSIDVRLDGEALGNLNELECVDGAVWANVWQTDAIVRIDPSDGRVTGVLDMRGLLEPHPAENDSGAVLNGIAWDHAAGTFLVTGKYWPVMIEIRLLETGE